MIRYQFGLEEIPELVHGESPTKQELLPLAFNVQVLLFIGNYVGGLNDGIQSNGVLS
jgi:hypothetical protein